MGRTLECRCCIRKCSHLMPHLIIRCKCGLSRNSLQVAFSQIRICGKIYNIDCNAQIKNEKSQYIIITMKVMPMA